MAENTARREPKSHCRRPEALACKGLGGAFSTRPECEDRKDPTGLVTVRLLILDGRLDA